VARDPQGNLESSRLPVPPPSRPRVTLGRRPWAGLDPGTLRHPKHLRPLWPSTPQSLQPRSLDRSEDDPALAAREAGMQSFAAPAMEAHRDDASKLTHRLASAGADRVLQ